MNQSFICLALTLVCYFFIPTNLHAQGLLEGDFETWVSSGRQPPFDWSEPLEWKSTNAVTEFTQAGITLSTDAQSGNSAALIRTVNVFGGNIPGILANGQPVLDFPNNTLKPETGGTPITTKPTRLTGHYRFSSSTPGDSCFMLVLLKKYNSTTNTSDTVGMGSKSFGPQSAYTSFDVMIADMSPGTMPDTVVVAFYSSKPSNPLAGGELLIDNVALDVNTAIKPHKQYTDLLTVFPNPTNNRINLTFEKEVPAGYTIELYSASGKRVFSSQTRNTSFAMDLEYMRPGMYLLKAYDNSGTQVWSRKVVKR